MSEKASQINGVSIVCRLLRHRAMKTSKLHVTGLCEGNSPVIGAFPAQRVSNAKKNLPFDDVIMNNLVALPEAEWGRRSTIAVR